MKRAPLVLRIDNDSYGKVGVYAGFSSRCAYTALIHLEM